jgi:MoxR-like ATPase
LLVLATRNPIENEGTDPLPEAQLDRFLLKVRVSYPTREQEREVLLRMSGGNAITVDPVIDPAGLLAARRAVGEVYVDQKLVDYMVDLVRATRDPSIAGCADLKPLIAFGASPRASLALAQTARAHAFLRGRGYVIPEDVKAMAPDVLRHRVILTFEAEAEEMDSDRVIARIVEAVPTP